MYGDMLENTFALHVSSPVCDTSLRHWVVELVAVYHSEMVLIATCYEMALEKVIKKQYLSQ